MTNLLDVTDTPLPVLPTRQAASHKGDYGRALVVGGSRGMSGAIAMAGLAALRGGAGLVTLAVPRSVQDVVASFTPCYMTHGMADRDGLFAAANAEQVLPLAESMTALALGPGLGRSGDVTNFVMRLYREVRQPMVVDADALFALAEKPEVLAKPCGSRVLTPHPGEFGRLAAAVMQNANVSVGLKGGDDQQRLTNASSLAKYDPTGRTVVVLKGHRTVVADGHRASVNQTGNPGMATGGSGDVLTGVITALLCQGLEPFDAARLGVHVHGLAGDLAALELGQVALIATDLVDYLPQAFQAVAE
jgi:ADP-dependent NAD(P)H-hydrate dehydratase